jgi:hypothetical protein
MAKRKYKYVNRPLSSLVTEKGLLVDLIRAKLNGVKAIEPGTDPIVTKMVEVEAEGTRNAFLKFLTHPKLNFTVSEFKGSVEIETFETEDLKVDISLNALLSEYKVIIPLLRAIVTHPSLQMNPPLLTLVEGADKAIETAIENFRIGLGNESGAKVVAIDARKDGGPSGRLKAIGHAHIGVKDPVPNSDTTNQRNDFTKVKLFPEKIPKDIL